jgi:hypothetical protein
MPVARSAAPKRYPAEKSLIFRKNLSGKISARGGAKAGDVE